MNMGVVVNESTREKGEGGEEKWKQKQKKNSRKPPSPVGVPFTSLSLLSRVWCFFLLVLHIHI